MIMEQLTNRCNKNLSVFLKERKCSNLQATVEAADNYLDAQVQRSLGSQSAGSTEDGVNPDYQDEKSSHKKGNPRQEKNAFFGTSMDTLLQIAKNERKHVRTMARLDMVLISAISGKTKNHRRRA